MKRGLFTTLCAALLFSACTRDDVPAPSVASNNNADSVLGAGPAPAGTPSGNQGLRSSLKTNSVLITDWEAGSNWTRTVEGTSARMKFSKNMHEITQSLIDNGAVIVYARGYNFADASMDRPMGMPFQFYLPYERMNLPVMWEYLEKMSGVDVSLMMSQDALQPFQDAQGNIKFRYFVFTPQELARLNKTPREMRQMSYEELTTQYSMIP